MTALETVRRECRRCKRNLYGRCFFQAEDGIRDLGRSRGRGDVYKRQVPAVSTAASPANDRRRGVMLRIVLAARTVPILLEELALRNDDHIALHQYRGAHSAGPVLDGIIVDGVAGSVSYTHLTLPTIFSVLISGVH